MADISPEDERAISAAETAVEVARLSNMPDRRTERLLDIIQRLREDPSDA